MAKRKSLSKKLRFSILVRDGHRCRYCGASGEAATLVVDHIIPVVQGGTGDPENLITACQPCNAGKSGRTPAESAPTASDAHRIELAVREQAEVADKIRQAVQSRIDTRQEICDFYCELRGAEGIDVGTLTTLCYFGQTHGFDTLVRWMEIAARRLPTHVNDRAFGRYVSGIRRIELLQATEATANVA